MAVDFTNERTREFILQNVKRKCEQCGRPTEMYFYFGSRSELHFHCGHGTGKNEKYVVPLGEAQSRSSRALGQIRPFKVQVPTIFRFSDRRDAIKMAAAANSLPVQSNPEPPKPSIPPPTLYQAPELKSRKITFED